MKNTVIIIISLLCMNCSFNNNKINVSAGENGNIQFEIPETISEIPEAELVRKAPNKSRRPNKMFVKADDATYEFNLNYKIDKGDSTLEDLNKLYSKLYKSKLPNPPGLSDAKMANFPSANTNNEFSSFSVLIG